MSWRRGLVFLAGLAAVAAVAVGAAAVDSQASFTTSSQSLATADTESAPAWLHLYSQATDPDGLPDYATQRVRWGTGSDCATGMDGTLTLVMGGVRGGWTSYTFNRAFTIGTETPFPDASVGSVTISASYIADPATGRQPIRDCRFSRTNQTGGNSSVTVGPNTKRQANIRIRMRPRNGPWVVGRTYYPTLRLTMTWIGGPAGYYVYDIPLSVTCVNW